jgi:hypothetical protein
MPLGARLMMGLAEGGTSDQPVLTAAEVHPSIAPAMGIMQNFGSHLLGSIAALTGDDR